MPDDAGQGEGREAFLKILFQIPALSVM